MKKQSVTINIDMFAFHEMKQRLWFKITLAAVIFVIANIIGGALSSVKLDLTEGRLYSLSPATKEIISKIDRDVTITYYVSEDLLKVVPNYIPYEERVRFLLEEISAHSKHVSFEHIKPELFSEEEDEAVAAGIRAVPLNDQGDKAYFGINVGVDKDGDKTASIGFLQIERENFLEYDIVKLLVELDHQTNPTIGIISDADPLGVGLLTGGRAVMPWASFEQLQEFYNLDYIFSPQDVFAMKPDMLLIAHSASMDDRMLWAVEQYLMRGGRALIYADPVFESGRILGPYISSLNSTANLNRIFKQWGVHIPNEQVIADPEHGIVVNIGAGNEIEPILHVGWLRYDSNNIADGDLAMADLNLLNIATVGEIQVKEPGKVQLDPLLQSSVGSQLYDAARFGGDRPDLEGILRDYTEGGEERILAARIIGSFETIFPKGRPHEDKEGQKEGDGHSHDEDFDWPSSLKKSEKPFEVILVADTDILQDRFWVRRSDLFGDALLVPFAGNGAMLENAVENLSGSPALGKLRSRGTRQRPFTLLNNIRQYAEQNYRVRANELSRKLDELQISIDQLQDSPDSASQQVQQDQKVLEEKIIEMLQTRRELRNVRRDLNRDFETVNRLIKGFNILFVPTIVVIVGIVIFRRRRAKRQFFAS